MPLVGRFTKMAAITPHDTTALSPRPQRLLVASGGTVVFHPVCNAAGTNITLTDLPEWAQIEIEVDLVLDTGTTATEIYGIYGSD